jgi:hypothetical protein
MGCLRYVRSCSKSGDKADIAGRRIWALCHEHRRSKRHAQLYER